MIPPGGIVLRPFDGFGLCGLYEIATVEVDPSPEETGGSTFEDDEFLGIPRNRLYGGLDWG